MVNFLAFTVSAPIGSSGSIAIGDIRPSYNKPTHSQMIGFICNALGITRDKDQQILEIEKALGLSFLIQSDTTSFEDFHTITIPKVKAKNSSNDEDEGNTIVSRRQYKTDMFFTCVIWLKDTNLVIDNRSITLELIQHSLISPEHPLFVGRKSCSLSLPLNPLLLDEPNPIEALKKYKDMIILQINDYVPKSFKDSKMITISKIDADIFSLSSLKGEYRRDKIRNRKLWQFDERLEAIIFI